MTAREAFTIQVVGQDGEFLQQMDEVPVVDPFRPLEEFRRHLEVPPDGSVLSAHTERYRIDRWNPETGELLSAHARDVDWFPAPDPDPMRGPPDHPPPPAVTGMELDAEGRLWLSLSRPAADWRDRLERPGRPGNPEGGGGRLAIRPRLVAGCHRGARPRLGARALQSEVVELQEVRDQALRLIAPGWLALLDEDDIVPVYRMYRVRLAGM